MESLALEVIQQDELFDESQLPAGRDLLLPVDVQEKRFTAEHVARNQAKYCAIVAALSEGLGVRQIARAFAVSHHTVAAVREREQSLVAAGKEVVGRRLHRLIHLATERLEEALEQDELHPGQLPVAIGILIDKSLLWSGQATSNVLVRHELAQDELKRLLARIIDVPATATAGECQGGSTPDMASGTKEPESQ